jgi:hypothetical protein
MVVSCSNVSRATDKMKKTERVRGRERQSRRRDSVMIKSGIHYENK